MPRMQPEPPAAQTAPGAQIGIDIGGTKALAVRLDDAGEVLTEALLPSPRRKEEVGPTIEALVAELAGAGTPLVSLGIGVPALVDGDGRLRFSPHLAGLVGLSLVDELAATLPGVAVWVGNDATAAGWAEHSVGAGVGAEEMLMVTLGTGIGGGMVSGGRIREGAHRFGGEFGHMVIDPHGPLCPCGNRGCWERYASGSGLGQLGREAAMAGIVPRVVELAGGDEESVRGEHVTRAAEEGDGPAIELMASFAWWLALGLANLVTILDPGLVVLGGGLIDAGEVLMGPVRRAFATLVEAGEQRGPVTITPAALGSRAGAVGAGLLAAAAPGAGAGEAPGAVPGVSAGGNGTVAESPPN